MPPGVRGCALSHRAGHQTSLLAGLSPSSVGLSQQKVHGRIGEKLRKPERQSWLSQVHPVECGSSRGCPGHASCSFLNCSGWRGRKRNLSCFFRLWNLCSSFLDPPSLHLESSVSSVSLVTKVLPSSLCPVLSASLDSSDNAESPFLSCVGEHSVWCQACGTVLSPLLWW